MEARNGASAKASALEASLAESAAALAAARASASDAERRAEAAEASLAEKEAAAASNASTSGPEEAATFAARVDALEAAERSARDRAEAAEKALEEARTHARDQAEKFDQAHTAAQADARRYKEYLDARAKQVATLESDLQRARADAEAARSAAQPPAPAMPPPMAPLPPPAPAAATQRTLRGGGASGDLALLHANVAGSNQGLLGSYTNKKNEDVGVDIESAILSGGGGGENFAPLLGRVKSMGAAAPALRSPAVLQAAARLDKLSVYLQRRPLVRLALMVYVIIVHLLYFFG